MHEPGTVPSKSTVNEMSALGKFFKHRTASAPWLLGFVRMSIPSGIHRRGIVGGYLAFMLISKISATQLSSYFLKTLTLVERDQIRADFKKAYL